MRDAPQRSEVEPRDGIDPPTPVDASIGWDRVPGGADGTGIAQMQVCRRQSVFLGDFFPPHVNFAETLDPLRNAFVDAALAQVAGQIPEPASGVDEGPGD